jgi:signal transduction histidine kinase
MGGAARELDLFALGSLCEAATRPLLLERVAESRFSGLGFPDLLACPIPSDQGVLVLGGAGFARRQLDLLSIVALQLGTSLENARLHAQLVQSSKMAAVGQLAAGVAHELNNPLGAVVLANDTALKVLEKNPALSRQLLEQAQTGAHRARSIVEKLLTYSRVRAPSAIDVLLGDVVRDTLELMQHQLSADGVAVQLALADVQARCDPHQLQQVLTNLILNARNAGAERVSVRVYARDSEAVLEVEDSGPGVAPEVAERIFEPFFTTMPVGRGTGLGLSVSRELVRQDGGELEFLGGSRFEVRLALTS